jgi:hypothetical protein
MNETTAKFSWWLVTHNALFAGIREQDDQITSGAELARIIEQTYFPAWKSHPDYRPSGEDPHNPMVVAVWSHEALKGHTESYMIARLGDVLAPAHMEWGRRTLGEFKCVRPILSTVPVHPSRISFISWSIKGKGRAFRCRQELKSLLPTKYHKLLSLVRKAARTPKTAYLSEWLLNEKAGQKVNLRNRSELPEWYNHATADQLNFARWKQLAGRDLDGLDRYIRLGEFWRAATGKMHPDDVITLVTHQISLPGISE